jgi:tetratricopeptide (TPR) repeat protein
MAPKSSYTDVVHHLVRDAEEPLTINEIVDLLVESEAENPPKNPRATVRSAVRSSGLIKPMGKSQFDWLPRILVGVRLRHTLNGADLSERKLRWDTDALIAQWPAVEEPETRRERQDVTWQLSSGGEISLTLEESEECYLSDPGPAFWAWLDEQNGTSGDDLILTATDPLNHRFEVQLEKRHERNAKLLEERNRAIKRRTETFLKTQRDNLAKPREIVSSLFASNSYHDSIPPQSLSNLLPEAVLSRYGVAVPPDTYEEKEETKESNVIPFPNKSGEESAEGISRHPEGDGHTSSVALEIPFNTGRELPDEKAYLEGLQLLNDRATITPALAIHVLNLSRLCSPAYALLSQTSDYRKEALDLAGQSVVAAERRIAHGLIESVITGEDFDLEFAIGDYLESRSFLARALWHAGSFEDAIEQAMHCFEVDPEDPGVREDLFVMLFDTDRHEMVLRLLESFPGASMTERLYHQALAALLDDPESKEAKKALRKAVSHNTHLACLFLGEDPKKAKRSSIEESSSYEAAYGFLWRREDAIFDMLEEIVLARR